MKQRQLYKKITGLLLIIVLLVSTTSSAYEKQDPASYMLGKKSKTLDDLYHALEEIRGDDNVRAVAWNDSQKDDSINFKKPNIFISLGMNCAVGFQFEAKKLVEAFFPFDWCISDFESIYTALQTEFKDYLNRENLVVLERPEKAAHHYIRDTAYNIMYLHDFSLKGEPLSDYEAVKNKYQRRIARFYRALTLGKKVYFFRTGITKQQAIELNDLITSKFPKLKYTLIAIDQTEEYKKTWQIKHIRNFFLENFHDAGMGSQKLLDGWNAIFKSIKPIKKAQAKPKPQHKAQATPQTYALRKKTNQRTM